MNYKEGDRVRIKPNLEFGFVGWSRCVVTSEMADLAGKEAIIQRVDPRTYKLDCFPYGWWDDDMLESIEESDFHYNVGDCVQVKLDLPSQYSKECKIYISSDILLKRGEAATIVEARKEVVDRNSGKQEWMYLLDIFPGEKWDNSMLEPLSLEYASAVEFKVGTRDLHYVVGSTHLIYSQGLNDEIFDLLEIKDKYKFCTAAYRYPANLSGSLFPCYKEGDYAAAKRVIDALRKACDNYNLSLFSLSQSSVEMAKDEHINSSSSKDKSFKSTKEIKLNIKHNSYKFKYETY